MTEKEAIKAIEIHYSKYYSLPNIWYFRWESDVLVINDSDYILEIEIKVSRSDFLADFKKNVTAIFRNADLGQKVENMPKHDFLLDNRSTKKPNKFFYAAPERMLSIEDIPKHCGWIEIGYKEVNGAQLKSVKKVKEAPFLHKEKKIQWRSLFHKTYFKYVDAKNTIVDMEIEKKH